MSRNLTRKSDFADVAFGEGVGTRQGISVRVSWHLLAIFKIARCSRMLEQVVGSRKIVERHAISNVSNHVIVARDYPVNVDLLGSPGSASTTGSASATGSASTTGSVGDSSPNSVLASARGHRIRLSVLNRPFPLLHVDMIGTSVTFNDKRVIFLGHHNIGAKAQIVAIRAGRRGIFTRRVGSVFGDGKVGRLGNIPRISNSDVHCQIDTKFTFDRGLVFHCDQRNGPFCSGLDKRYHSLLGSWFSHVEDNLVLSVGPRFGRQQEVAGLNTNAEK